MLLVVAFSTQTHAMPTKALFKAAGYSSPFLLLPLVSAVHKPCARVREKERERGSQAESQAPPPDDISAVLKRGWRQMQPHTCSELQAADQLCRLFYLVSLSLSLSQRSVCVCEQVCVEIKTHPATRTIAATEPF